MIRIIESISILHGVLLELLPDSQGANTIVIIHKLLIRANPNAQALAEDPQHLAKNSASGVDLKKTRKY